MLNAFWDALEFELPDTGERMDDGWHRLIDTSLKSPDDIRDWASAPVIAGSTYLVQARSAVTLFTRVPNGSPG